MRLANFIKREIKSTLFPLATKLNLLYELGSDILLQMLNSSIPVSKSHLLDDYGTLLLAEALLEEGLQDNMDLLRSSTPVVDQNQEKLSRAKGHLNTILSRGRLSVSHRHTQSSVFTWTLFFYPWWLFFINRIAIT